MHRFYTLSAEGGDAEAQMRLGLTYLPTALDGEPVTGVGEARHRTRPPDTRTQVGQMLRSHHRAAPSQKHARAVCTAGPRGGPHGEAQSCVPTSGPLSGSAVAERIGAAAHLDPQAL